MVMLPVVVVPSVYVPLALAVQVPLTLREPESVTFVQAEGSSPALEMSRFVLRKSRHDELTFQVPTTSPPQAVIPGQVGAPPPPVPAVPLELPPVPDGLGEVAVHAPEIIPAMSAVVRAAERSFINGLLQGEFVRNANQGFPGARRSITVQRRP
jgi:hypothetical protein